MAETLLHVDDNPVRLHLMQTRLELLGYEVLTATSGSEALELFKSRHIDLAIVDYYMPGMTGDIVSIEMKRIRPEVPIIIFSGTFTLPEMVIAFVDGFVSASDQPDALLDKISQLLRSKRRDLAG